MHQGKLKKSFNKELFMTYSPLKKITRSKESCRL